MNRRQKNNREYEAKIDIHNYLVSVTKKKERR